MKNDYYRIEREESSYAFRCGCCNQMQPRSRTGYWMRRTMKARTLESCGTMGVCKSCAHLAKKLKLKTIMKLRKKLFGNAKLLLFIR